MSGGPAEGRPRPSRPAWRSWCLLAAIVAVVVSLVPPLATLARRTEYMATLQFSLLAIAVPVLVTLGAPWHWLGLAGDPFARGRLRPFDRLADRRRRHRELPWSLAFIGCGLGVAIGWHTPAAVNALAAHGWLVVVEAPILLVFGLGLWFELVPSPPLAPRSGHLRRAVLAAFAMWAFWILAYVTGLSNRGFYRNFHHVAGSLSAAADQQIASAVLWAVAAAAFVPVIFWNALMWLKSEEDPDLELQSLARTERRAGGSPAVHHRDGPTRAA